MIVFWLLFGSIAIYSAFGIFFLLGLLRLRFNNIDHKNNLVTVSVVIAARNENENLPFLIKDLIEQDFPTTQLEIIIADDRSSDNTWATLTKTAAEQPHFKPVRITEQALNVTPKKNALSVAISISSGKIIVTTDADCRVPKNWVTSMVNVLINSPAGIAIGYSTITAQKHSVLEQYQKIDFLALMAANAGSTGWGFAWSGSGQNLAYYRKHFDSIGGFQPVADRVSGDDVYLVQSIGRKYGAIFNNNADGYVHTVPVPTTFQFLRQRVRWASNSRHLPGFNWFFLSFLISAFICNTALITALFFSTAIVYLPIAIIIKFLIDGLVIFIGANQFRTPIHPAIFILWSFLQPVYIPLIGITGLISQFTWKD